MSNRPPVTVVVPLLNAAWQLPELMEALLRQTWPGRLTEIILVDNGSTDGTAAIAENYVSGPDSASDSAEASGSSRSPGSNPVFESVPVVPGMGPGGASPPRVLFLSETGNRSPYAARNRGIDAGSGEIFALLDANKIPDPLWLQSGVNAMMKHGASLAGGAIQFRLTADASPGELTDAVLFNNNRELVARDGGSAAGNLFFRRDVWVKTGPFPSSFRSGMDIWWTREATRNGFSLIYVPEAVVRCIPRKGLNVVRKGYRVGKVHPHNMRADGESTISIFSKSLRTFAPPRPLWIRTRLSEIGVAGSTPTTINVWGFVWMARMAMAAGRLAGFVSGGSIPLHPAGSGTNEERVSSEKNNNGKSSQATDGTNGTDEQGNRP